MRAIINEAGCRILEIEGNTSAIVCTIAGYIYSKGGLGKFTDALNIGRNAVDRKSLFIDETCQVFIE